MNSHVVRMTHLVCPHGLCEGLLSNSELCCAQDSPCCKAGDFDHSLVKDIYDDCFGEMSVNGRFAVEPDPIVHTGLRISSF